MNSKTKGNHSRKRLADPKGSRTDSPCHQHMKCARCDGAMIFERFQATMEIFYAWRCVNCGDIMDQVVQKNRELVMAQKRQAAGENGCAHSAI